MANPYSKYTGARVQAVPADYYRSLGKIGEMYERGIASVGKTIGGAIESYYDKKNKHEALDEQYDNLKRFLEPKAKVELPDELGGGAMEIELEGEHPSLADFAEKSVSEKESKVKDMLFLREKFFKDREHELDLGKHKLAKKIAEDRKTYQDAMLSAEGHEAARKRGEERGKEQQERDAVTRYNRSKGAYEKLVIMGYYDPTRDIVVPPELRDAAGHRAMPVGESFVPGLRDGTIPSEDVYKAMSGAATADEASRIWKESQSEPDTAAMRELQWWREKVWGKSSEWNVGQQINLGLKFGAFSPHDATRMQFNQWMDANPSATPTEKAIKAKGLGIITGADIDRQQVSDEEATRRLENLKKVGTAPQPLPLPDGTDSGFMFVWTGAAGGTVVRKDGTKVITMSPREAANTAASIAGIYADIGALTNPGEGKAPSTAQKQLANKLQAQIIHMKQMMGHKLDETMFFDYEKTQNLPGGGLQYVPMSKDKFDQIIDAGKATSAQRQLSP